MEREPRPVCEGRVPHSESSDRNWARGAWPSLPFRMNLEAATNCTNHHERVRFVIIRAIRGCFFGAHPRDRFAAASGGATMPARFNLLNKSPQVHQKMEEKEYRAIAHDLCIEAYEYQMEGEFDTAIELYQRSILAYPTAEAHTSLGWIYGEQGRLDEAISECKRAIYVDPDFGKPYNDIGAYLIEKSEHEEAIPWLEKALKARRYDQPHHAYCNLGRIYVALEMYNKARWAFETALSTQPGYEPALESMVYLKRLIQ